MDEYIERKPLLNHYKALANIEWNKKVAPVSWADAYESFIEHLEELPTADVVEVVHGEWIEHDLYICDSDDEPVCKIGTIFICSVCGREENHKELYCHCGAKMDGKVLPHKFLGKSQDGECGVEILDGKGDCGEKG